VSDFQCANGAPEYIVGSATCLDEEEAFYAGIGSEDGAPCQD
jgi:hypothetical protein